MYRYDALISADKAPICLFISRTNLPSLEQVHKRLKLLDLRQRHNPDQQGALPFLRFGTMTSDLERLTFIAATSHLAANCSGAHGRSWLEETIITTSSAKSRDETLMFPNQIPFSSQLCLEFQPINTTKFTTEF